MPAAQALANWTAPPLPIAADGATALEAQQTAVDQGQRTAFDSYLKQITLPAFWPKLAALEIEDISPYIAGWQVEQPQSGATRYEANLLVTFDTPAVTQMLLAQNIPAAVKPLVVTLEARADAAHAESWQQAWADFIADDALQAAHGTQLFELQLEADAPAKDGVLRAELAEENGQFTNTLLWQGRDNKQYALGTAASAALETLPLQSVKQAVQTWKRHILQQPGDERKMLARVPITSLKDWLAKQQALRDIPAIQTLDVVRLSAREVLVQVMYNGGLNGLKQQLARQQFSLEPDNQDWLIRQTASVGQ